MRSRRSGEIAWLIEGEVEGVGLSSGTLRLRRDERSAVQERAFPQIADAVEAILDALDPEVLAGS